MKTITHPTLVQLVAAGAVRVVVAVGQPGGWTLLVRYGVVCGRGRNPTLRLWPTIFSGKIDVFPGDRRSRLISSRGRLRIRTIKHANGWRVRLRP